MLKQFFDSGNVPDPDEIFLALEDMERRIAKKLINQLTNLYEDLTIHTVYRPDAKSAGQRSLRNTVLKYITRIDGGKTAFQQFKTADNMTEQLSSLGFVISGNIKNSCAEDFYTQWHSDALVIDKWFAIQIFISKSIKCTKYCKRIIFTC